MKNRKKRIDIIIDIIRDNCIGSQEELAKMLEEQGHHVTQATLSRDLKMLRTTKVPTDRGPICMCFPRVIRLKTRFCLPAMLLPRQLSERVYFPEVFRQYRRHKDSQRLCLGACI